jgi:hypothetical protein
MISPLLCKGVITLLCYGEEMLVEMTMYFSLHVGQHMMWGHSALHCTHLNISNFTKWWNISISFSFMMHYGFQSFSYYLNIKICCSTWVYVCACVCLITRVLSHFLFLTKRIQSLWSYICPRLSSWSIVQDQSPIHSMGEDII